MWSMSMMVNPQIIPSVMPIKTHTAGINTKKRLLSTVQDILNTSDIDIFRKRQIIEAQEETFDEYANQLNLLKTKLMSTEQQLQSQGRHVSRLYAQINQKSQLINKKNKDLSYQLGIINTLRSEIDSYQLRVIDAETQNEENIIHYKNIISTLTKDKNTDMKANDYMSHIRKVVKSFENGESINALNSSESKCVICLQQEAKFICYPCCHLEFCGDCAGLYVGKDESFFRNNNELSFNSGEKFQCTRCKSDIEKIHYIFS